MNARLSNKNILVIAKEILGLAGLACLALACTVPTWAGTNQAAGNQAGAAVSQPQAPPATPQAPNSAATAKPAAPAEKNPASRAKGAHEGITVHGHWTIEVRNPDGKVVTHREFENSLQSNGGDTLTGLLSGQYVSGGFTISLEGSRLLCGLASNCLLYDTRNTVLCPAASATAGQCGTMTYMPNVNSGGFTLGYTLTGNVKPTAGWVTNYINIVQSGVLMCSAGSITAPGAPLSQTSPSMCDAAAPASANTNITGTTITNVPVIAGQSVAVTVVITFGSS